MKGKITKNFRDMNLSSKFKIKLFFEDTDNENKIFNFKNENSEKNQNNEKMVILFIKIRNILE